MSADKAAARALEWVFGEIGKTPIHLGNVEFLRHLILTLIDLGLTPDHPFLYRYLQALSSIDETMDWHVAPQKCLVYSRLGREASYIINVAKKIDFDRETPDKLFISIMCTVMSDFPEIFSRETLTSAKSWLEREIERDIKEENCDALSYNLASYYRLMRKQDERTEKWIEVLQGFKEEDHWHAIGEAWGDELSVTASCVYNLIRMGVEASSDIMKKTVAWYLRLVKLDGSWENNIRSTVKILRALVAASSDKEKTRDTLMGILRENEAKQLMEEMLAVMRTSAIEGQLKLQLVSEGQLVLLQKGTQFKESVKSLISKIANNPDIAKLTPTVIEISTRLISLLVAK